MWLDVVYVTLLVEYVLGMMLLVPRVVPRAIDTYRLVPPPMRVWKIIFITTISLLLWPGSAFLVLKDRL